MSIYQAFFKNSVMREKQSNKYINFKNVPWLPIMQKRFDQQE